MCILFIAIDQHADYPLIIAANRDEFHHRPTAQSHFWQQHPDLLAGRDLQAHGTWMGMTRGGRISALTNVRDPLKVLPDAVTRGELVTHFLLGNSSQSEYLNILRKSKNNYNGYNLLFGDWHDLWVYNNHTDQIDKLLPGFYGLSNADLNSPWPKINQGVAQLKRHCLQSNKIDPDKLFDILLDQTQSTDDLLPQTGIPIEWERKLSSVFIKSPDYGTRSATLLMIDRNNNANWIEHTFNSEGENIHQQQFSYKIS